VTAAGGRAVVGLSAVVSVDEVAGVFVTRLDQGGEDLRLEPRGVLQSSGQVAFLTRRCPVPLLACADAERIEWASLNDLTSGARRWELPVVGAGVDTRLVEPALFDVPRADGSQALGLGLLHELSVGAASRLVFQLLLEGDRVLICPLHDRSVRSRGAVFSGRQLFVLAGREDGGFALEAYDLKSLPLHQGDWSAPGGPQGWRRAP
jgi:hypothetical protein